MLSFKEKYQLIRSLGSQHKRKFGSVYLIKNRTTGDLSVLKHLDKSSVNIHLQERLRKEATFSFDHLGLPKTIDFIESENEISVVKNYTPGISLEEYWKTIPKRKKLQELIKLTEQLVPILNYLQANKIVHCDLKPSNIIVNKSNDQLNVSLIDFGLALNLNEQNNRSTLFPLGYASPELLLNKMDLVDHRSDLFSFGIIIWKLFNDKLPLTHPNPSIYTNLQLTHPLPDSNELPKGLYKLLVKLCVKCHFKTSPNNMKTEDVISLLDEAKKERYINIEEFLSDLKKLPIQKKWFNF